MSDCPVLLVEVCMDIIVSSARVQSATVYVLSRLCAHAHTQYVTHSHSISTHTSALITHTHTHALACATALNHTRTHIHSAFAGETDAVKRQLVGLSPGSYTRILLRRVPCEFIKCFNPTLPLLLGGVVAQEAGESILRVRIKKHRHAWH